MVVKRSEIHNAGLVLIHPFLEPLFKTLKLTEFDAFVNRDAQIQAMYMLDEICPSNNNGSISPLSMILCGITSTDQITSNANTIDNMMKDEVNHMLQATINNWDAVGNISIPVFIDEFIKKRGVLNEFEDSHQLTLESKSTDILLERLPWSINLIKLPWMNKILSVEF